MRHFSDEQRRARLARRHGIHPGHRHPDPLAATTAMTVLHATEPPTVHLALAARVDGISIADVEAALYDDRVLVKQLAMRRTLFAFPRDLLPAAWASASARVAGTEFRRLVASADKAGVDPDPAAWVEAATQAVLQQFAAGAEFDAVTIRKRVPIAETRLTWGSGKWTQELPLGPHLLTLLGARGEIVRGRNGGHWRISKPRWTAMTSWLGELPSPVDGAAGYAELVRRWLWTFGPGTEADLVWWLGSTKSAARRALVEVGAEQVSLDSGEIGWVLPGDIEPEPDVGPWAALLPTLDPTTMGWKQRDFYLDPADVPYLFDSVGNAGPTAWWNGRIVGCWVQEPDGRVQVVPRGDLGRRARAALDREAARLTDWFGGEVVSSVFGPRQARGERLG
ncbi:MAG: winged helix DNA-binding domain-containing protein [Actinobacteria bacterium]|nr:winged helix DNA-binding domain-containing protein [Actinomycetota bacterium]